MAKYFGVADFRGDGNEKEHIYIHRVDEADEGYQLAFRIATDNLKCGLCVVADSCHPVSKSHTAWQYVATDLGIQFFNIEVICSDKAEYQ
jgi:predicted kinase